MSRPPVYRPISWLGTIPQIVVYSVVCGTVYAITGSVDWAILIGMPIMLIYSITSRYVVPYHHRQGVHLMSQFQFEEALIEHQKSLEFFEKYPWIDNFRAVVLMSPSPMSYREMALCNLGNCYLQLSRWPEAQSHYEQALKMGPKNRLAQQGLRLVESQIDGKAAEGEPEETP